MNLKLELILLNMWLAVKRIPTWYWQEACVWARVDSVDGACDLELELEVRSSEMHLQRSAKKIQDGLDYVRIKIYLIVSLLTVLFNKPRTSLLVLKPSLG